MTAADLQSKKCVPCEGGVPKLPPDRVAELLAAVPGWTLAAGDHIRRVWMAADFQTALDFANRVGRLAEDEGHHPDLHLTAYRHLAVELTTHAAGGLTENDFVLAAKIDALPPPRRKG